MMRRQEIMADLYRLIQERKTHSSDESYVASLYAKGLDKVLSKIGEEATELALAGKGGETDQVVYEMADLWFHCLVLLGFYDLEPERVFLELERRLGTSGLKEKAERGEKHR
ncbi:MAG: phosphoribosyl-ATP diphosphatase [Deltaproteobacteria bacterium]|nr:phosphoribosyl-ATP diphosphatase [Deltaproteobacteria bacterium]